MTARGALKRFAVASAAFAVGAALWLFFGPAPSLVAARGTRLASPIYARALLITPGDSVRALDLEGHLARTGYRRISGPEPAPGDYVRGRTSFHVGRRGFSGSAGGVRAGRVRIQFSGDRVTRIVDGHGRSLPRASLEPERIGVLESRGARWQDRVSLDAVPERVVDALLAVEDRRFLEHGGLDLRRIGGAALANARAGRVVQGGSTLTQQLARSLYLDRERSWLRKLREALLAMRIERGHDKREILAAYVNEIYMGHREGLPVHGLATASRFWFGRKLSELDLAEQALLVGMIQAPNRFGSGRRPELTKARRAAVLEAMQQRGVISAEQAKQAEAAPLPSRPPARKLDARYYLDWLRSELERADLSASLEAGGVYVQATLDARLQRAAEAAVENGLASLEKSRPKLEQLGRRPEAALVAIDPRSGDVLALVGGRDYARSQFNRATQARRQPGSAFKPIVALAALGGDGGWPEYTLASPLEDAPVELDTPMGRWRPQNHDGEFRGRVTLRTALEQSLNVPIARLGMELGAPKIIEAARSLGVESPLDPVASLSLGVSALTPLELTHAYAVLAAGGTTSPVRAWSQVLATDGEELAMQSVRRERAVDPAAAYLVTSALRGAVEHGTARRLRALGVRAEVAAKTGTTNDYRDAWLVGYTPEIALGVWVGIDDGEPVGATGAGAALPIFADFLVRSGFAARDAEFERPESVQSVRVDLASGLRAGLGCPGEPELFLAGTEPEKSCGWFARAREPERPRRRSRPWWFFGLGEEDVSMAPPARRSHTPEHPATCRVRLLRLQRAATFRGGVEYAYQVGGTAGQAGWLRLSAPFPRRIEGFPVRVEPGKFDRTLEIELPRGAEGLLVELELENGKRCTDSARLPAD